MATGGPHRVDYIASARRHLRDAYILQKSGRNANAGQLFGFSVECALKSVLVRTGANIDADGNILRPLREHLPKLSDLISAMTTFPDGRSAGLISGYTGNLASLSDWTTDHRYWRQSAIPLGTSIAGWEMAALEMDDLLDNLTLIGL